jgi:hypothetical protein
MLSKKIIERLYLVNKKTDVEIACLLACNKQSVYKARKRFGIKAIDRWERNDCKPTQKQTEIIYGSLLGDGSISNGIKGDYKCQSIFEEKHASSQKSYINWKYNELKTLCTSAPKWTGERWRIRTFHHPFFSNLRREFYPNGKKVVTESILSKITPLGLAVWFMDDGTMCNNFYLKLCTCGFDLKEHVTMIKWFEDRFGVKVHNAVDRGYNNLIVDVGSKRKFLAIVKPFIIPEMQYKIELGENYE